MFIDTHCHLTDNYTDGVDGVIARAHDAGVGTLICPTANPADIKSAIDLTQRYKNIYATIGIHPEYAGTVRANDVITDDILKNPRVVGIGEIGLDYHMGDENRMAQIELFTSQLDIARRANMPVAIHTRDAERDTAEILRDVCGVMHCYTSSWDLAKTMLDRGFYFSASGILTFKNADAIRDTFSRIPIDRIVIETDAPYCAPVPYRGQTCEPFMVPQTAHVVADIHKMAIDDLAPILIANTRRLYPRIK